ncbi:unnamed protein product [marine sediment metagenome]|uniref:Uncharacterized protein n=1 Tax=marine sediment metagenome TaxID=412755 RepID=X1JXX4_9ZZZZ
MDLFVKVDTGTDNDYRWIINPLFLLLANWAMANVKVVATLFGITNQRSEAGG